MESVDYKTEDLQQYINVVRYTPRVKMQNKVYEVKCFPTGYWNSKTEN